jgi:acyl transferase domain-containing protein
VERPLHLLTLSAKSEAALEELARRYTDTLDSPALSWPDVCFTANAGRSHFAERLAVVAASAGTAREKLGASLAGETPPGLIRGQAQTGRWHGTTAL